MGWSNRDCRFGQFDHGVRPDRSRQVRRHLPVRLVVVLSAMLLGTAGLAPAQAEGDLKVVATIKPVHALVTAIMEGVGQPSVLMAGNASPHTFSLKPSEARALHAADVVFRVSSQLEPFTIRIAASLPKSVRVVSLVEADGLRLLPRRAGDGFDRHDHGKGAGHGHDHTHGKSSKAGQSGVGQSRGDDANADPHVWLDPDNAKAMAHLIVKVLSERAPAHAVRFAANGQRLSASLDALAAEIASKLEPFRQRKLVVFHDAYQYFERRFALAVVGAITLNPEVAPSARRLADLRQRIVKLSAACVLSEPQFAPKIVAAIVEGSKAGRGTLDPVGGLLPPSIEHYHRTLRGMADAIASCSTAS